MRALLIALLLMGPYATAADVPQERMQLARVGLSLKDEVAKELRRREAARTFKSCVMDPKDPFSDLMRPAPYKVFFGGRDARKSWSFAEALIRITNAKRARVLCTRTYQNTIKDSVHKVLKDMIERLGVDHRFIVTRESITNPHTGSEFMFKGLQNPNEIKSMEGIDICWLAEAQDTTTDTLDTLDATIRKEGSELWIDFNVTSEDAPIYVQFVVNPPPGTIKHHVNFDSNPFLSTRSKAKIAHVRETDYENYLHIYEGVPRKLSEALIFKHWRVEGFDEEALLAQAIRQGGRLHLGMDHGFANDPYAVVRFFILDNVLYISHEAFGHQTEFAGEMAPGLAPGDEPRGELEQLVDSVPGTRDWPIKADNSRPETISFLRNKRFNVTAAEKWKGSVEDGIAHIKGFTSVVIHSRCKNMAQEARSYMFKVDKITKEVLPIVVDANNHGWDAVRYGLDGYIQQAGELSTWAKLAG